MNQKSKPTNLFLSDTLTAPVGMKQHPLSEDGKAYKYQLPYANDTVTNIQIPDLPLATNKPSLFRIFRECRRVLVPNGVLRIFIDTQGTIQNRQFVKELRETATFCGLQAGTPSNETHAKGSENAALSFTKKNRTISATPLISVIIPAFRSQFLEKAIDSCLTQSYKNLEIIVLDDSPDNKVEAIVRAHMQTDRRLNYLKNTPPLGEARNLTNGIRLASGELIKPVYDDDELYPGAIERLLNALKQNPDTTLAVGRRVPIDEAGSELDRGILGELIAETDCKIRGDGILRKIAEEYRNSIGEPTAMLFRREDALAIDERHIMTLHGRVFTGLGDVCIALHLLSRGDMAYLAQPVCKFRLHPEQSQHRPSNRNELRNTWEYLRKKLVELGFSPPFSPSPKSKLKYQQWLEHRSQLISEIQPSQFSAIEQQNTPQTYHLITYLGVTEQGLLANTLDSLEQQWVTDWHLDIITELPAPDGLDEIPCIGWHTINFNDSKRLTAEALVKAREADWVIELPAGVRLDPLYLWQLTNHANRHPSAQAFFVDDDLYSEDGDRSSSRFKPCENPSLLICSDLAGVLAAKHEAWLNRSEPISNIPWHNTFFSIFENSGMSAIKHIPDVLLSYAEHFPHDDAGHAKALSKFLEAQGIQAKLLGTGKHSWCLHYQLNEEPLVTVAILYKSGFILEKISRCIESLLKYTNYRNFELIVCSSSTDLAPEVRDFLEQPQTFNSTRSIRIVTTNGEGSYAALCNAAVEAARGEFVLLLDETSQIIQENWLTELVGACQHPEVVAVAPRMIQPGSSKLEYAGDILGLNGLVGRPYESTVRYDNESHKPIWTETPHDLSVLPESCFLIRRKNYQQVKGMDETTLADHFACLDLGLKLRAKGERIIYQPLANVVYQKSDETPLPEAPEIVAQKTLKKSAAKKEFMRRWWPNAAADPFWNPNLSLVDHTVTPDTECVASWHFVPTNAPRIMHCPMCNGQEYFRITAALDAACKQGRAAQLAWPQTPDKRMITPAELIRLAPDVLIVQNFMNNYALRTLAEIHEAPGRPYIIYALDDLITGLTDSNPHKAKIPPNPRERLQFALRHCDRLVVSTDYLAETYQHLIKDIVVVPNCLDETIWSPLLSHKRASKKPRIGWAGGTTHRDDLLLLREVIEATQHEADWILMGMCPDELRPFIKEYHRPVSMRDYPAYLASLDLDIAVAPLADTPFNHAKSNLRLLEYGMLAIPVVCSDITPYRNSPAYSVPNKPTAWIEALNTRTRDPNLRKTEGLAMLDWVRANFLLENNIDRWLEAHLPNVSKS